MCDFDLPIYGFPTCIGNTGFSSQFAAIAFKYPDVDSLDEMVWLFVITLTYESAAGSLMCEYASLLGLSLFLHFKWYLIYLIFMEDR